MKNLTITVALAAILAGSCWADFTWPTQDADINLNNRRISTFYKDGTTWAHRADVAGALGLDKEGEEMVDLQAACKERNVTFSTRSNGTIDAVVQKASAGAPVNPGQSQPRSYSGSGYHGSYSGSSSSSSRSKNGGHTKNYTPYSSQTEEYFNTHKANGRVFNLSTGEYVTGQENKVYVDGYTTKNGTVVNPVTRSYPSGSSRSSGGSYNYRSSSSSSRPNPNSTNGRPPLSEMKQGTGYPGQNP